MPARAAARWQAVAGPMPEAVRNHINVSADGIVPAFHLIRDHRSLAVQKKGLLRRQVPLVAKALVAVACAEFPERRVPRSALASLRVWARRNQPPLHDLLQETVLHQPFAVNPA